MAEFLGLVLEALSKREMRRQTERRDDAEREGINLDEQVIFAGSIEYGVIFDLIGMLLAWITLATFIVILNLGPTLQGQGGTAGKLFLYLNIAAAVFGIPCVYVGKRLCKPVMEIFNIRDLSLQEFGILIVMLSAMLGSFLFVTGSFVYAYFMAY